MLLTSGAEADAKNYAAPGLAKIGLVDLAAQHAKNDFVSVTNICDPDNRALLPIQTFPLQQESFSFTIFLSPGQFFLSL